MRAGLIFLAAAQGLAGLVQLFLPLRFYDDFPWVDLLPPYNEHLMRDVGALTLAYSFVLAAAAVRMDRRLVRIALIANLIFTVPHFVFHTTHLDHYSAGEAVTQTIVLGLGVLIPAGLLALAGRARDRAAAP